MSELYNRFLTLNKKVEDLRARFERQKGAVQSYLEILKKEFGCDSVEDGKARLNLLKHQLEKLDEKAEQSIRRIETQLGGTSVSD